MSSGRVGKAIVLTCFFTAGYGRHRKLGVGFRTAGYSRHRSQWVKVYFTSYWSVVGFTGCRPVRSVQMEKALFNR